MPKRFDCEDEPNEHMEEPCRCDCGKWFDLQDGHRKGKNIVCRDCQEPDEDSADDGSLDIEEEKENWVDELRKVGLKPKERPENY